MNSRCRSTQLNVVSLTMAIALSIACGFVFAAADKTNRLLIPAGSEWRYRATATAPPANWRSLIFEHSRWKAGKASFGYGYAANNTDLKQMRHSFAAVQIRHEFELDQPAATKTLQLYVRFDDGFIAYINGQEVARASVAEHNGKPKVEDHEADDFDVFTIDNAQQLLRSGKNVLAVEGFNRSLDSSDFTLHPVLSTAPVKNPQLPVTLTHEEVIADLDQFQRRLESDSSYLLAARLNLQESLQVLRKSPEETVNSLEFARDLQKVIAKIGDAHGSVDVELDADDDRYLPFILADSAMGIIAVAADQEELVAKDYPLLVAIDGKPVRDWLAVAAAYVPQGSPQLVRHQSLRELRSIDRMRADAGVDKSDVVSVTLASLDGKQKTQRQLQTLDTRLPSGKVPLGESRLLEGNIGYLRIPSMSRSATDEVLGQMAKFKSTDGLIIDVRGNGGGRYQILKELYGYFLPDNAAPYVTNIAAYRLSPHFDSDHLHYRSTFRLTYPGWSKQERRAINTAFTQFEPEWQIPSAKFSTWHFMLLGKSDASQQFSYQQPVVVLCNAASFSATDGFLSAFADLPNVTLVGQASAGGSGATKRFTLQNSGMEIALSSMASFRPNGKLFDGNGIAVDINAAPTPADFLGHTDSVLAKGIAWIQNSRSRDD